MSCDIELQQCLHQLQQYRDRDLRSILTQRQMRRFSPQLIQSHERQQSRRFLIPTKQDVEKELKSTVRSLQHTVQDLEAQLDRLNAERVFLNRSLKQVSVEKTGLTATVHAQGEELQGLQSLLEALGTSSVHDALKNVQTLITTAGLSSRGILDLPETAAPVVAQLQNEILTLQEQIAQSQRVIAQLEGTIALQASALTRDQAELNSINTAYVQAARQLQGTRAELSLTKQELQQTRVELNSTREELARIQIQLSGTQAELKEAKIQASLPPRIPVASPTLSTPPSTPPSTPSTPSTPESPSVSQQHQINELQRDLEDSQTENEAFLAALTKISAVLAPLLTQGGEFNLEEVIRVLNGLMESKEAEYVAIRAARERINKLNEEVTEREKQLDRDEKARQDEIKSLESKIKELQEEIFTQKTTSSSEIDQLVERQVAAKERERAAEDPFRRVPKAQYNDLARFITLLQDEIAKTARAKGEGGLSLQTVQGEPLATLIRRLAPGSIATEIKNAFQSERALFTLEDFASKWELPTDLTSLLPRLEKAQQLLAAVEEAAHEGRLTGFEKLYGVDLEPEDPASLSPSSSDLSQLTPATSESDLPLSPLESS